MKQSDELKQLVGFLKTENIILSDLQVSRLEVYLSQLIRFGSRHRIVSGKDLNYLVSRHFLSSFYFVNQIGTQLSAADTILDLGSGAGFPGIILSIVFPNKVVLIDSVRKKALFLKRIADELGLNCEVINERIESFSHRERRLFKIITARALASINDLIDLTKPFLPFSELHTLKGNDFRKENWGREEEIDLSFTVIEKEWIAYSGYLDNKVYIRFSARK